MNFAWVNGIRINRSAVEARAKTLGTLRTFKVEAQMAAYLNIIRCLDLTTLKGDDTEQRVKRLCAKALSMKVGAVCVYPNMVAAAVAEVREAIPVASVATGFPAGQTPLDTRIQEIESAVCDGAGEIDVVIHRPHVFGGKWKELYEEICEMRDACGEMAKMKVILGVGDLKTLDNIAKAAAVVILACRDGDFIKTSTGLEETNATLEAGLVMARQIRDSGKRVGLKPAGGIKTTKEAMLWYSLMLEELGGDWCQPELFRIGCSSSHDGLLADISRQLHHLATGRYSAFHHHPLG